jgi:hypothetical protein
MLNFTTPMPLVLSNLRVHAIFAARRSHLRFLKGNFLASEAECLVIPVAANGEVGKGLAAAFFARYPTAWSWYATACASGQLELGSAHLVRAEPDRTIAFVAMRQSPEESTALEWIEKRLLSLRAALEL